jgi:hypothetical protein
VGRPDSAVRPWRELNESQRRDWATAIAPTVTVDRVRRAIVVSGACPACGCSFLAVHAEGGLHAELAGGPRGGPGDLPVLDWDGALRFLVVCYCETEHAGRPSVVSHGCGASGWLIDEP